MKTTVVLIDGGFLRSQTKKAKKKYDPPFIEKFALSCIAADEECLRILYYDCAPYVGSAVQPVSGLPREFSGSDRWLHEIAALDLFAVRRGVLKFRGFKRSSRVVRGATPTDADFDPQFEQKGVDMRIGLDIAAYSAEHLTKRIILITNDTDCVPAMKFARKAGLQTILIKLPNCNPTPELIAHADFKRSIGWP
ncbi:MAG: NYN domain-containing protein [Acidobacteriota bacterium]|nr:NYN domain-containing protein [Acidobacteriota bacterium]